MGATISSNNPRTLILGANGCVGNATIEAMMLRRGGRDGTSTEPINVTAGIRDEKKFAKKMLQVPTVHADFSDLVSLKKAMRNHDILFIIVPSSKNRTQYATNAIKAAKDAGTIKYILLLSVTIAEADYTIFGEQFASIEEETKKCGIPYTIIRLPLFMENTFQYKDSIIANKKGNNNKKTGSSYFEDPRDPRTKIASVSVEDVGKCSADILRNPQPHAYQTYNLVGQKYSMIDLTQSMSKVLGRQIKVREIAYHTFKKSQLQNGIPQWQLDGLIEWLEHTDDIDEKLTSEDLQTITKITGERPTTVDHFIACNAMHFGWRIK